MKRPESEMVTDCGVDSFYSRWSKRKQEYSIDETEKSDDENSATLAENESLPPAPDQELPPLEELNEKSDYTGFLSSSVSDGVRRLALRKLFHSSDFNICDGLDDYAEDFNTFEKLGDIITSDMLHQLHVAGKKLVKTSDPDMKQPHNPKQAESNQNGCDDDLDV